VEGLTAIDDCQELICQPLLLPLSSVIPPSPQSEPGETPVEAAAQCADTLCLRLRDEIVTARELSVALEQLAVHTAAAGRTVTPARHCDEQSSRQALLRSLGDEARDAAIEHADYDRYFGFRRVPGLSASEIAAETVRTIAEVCADLPSAVLALDEMIALLDALAGALRWCSSRTPYAGDTTPAEPGATGAVSAERRWILGHHLFNLLAMLCVAELTAAGDSLAADRVRGAALYLRGTTAAMWYAGNFPPRVYMEQVRTAMVAHSGTSAGFSGTQNLEYLRLRDTMDAFKESLAARLGDAGAWPPDFYAAVSDLCEVEVEDVEHHVLIAATKVGRMPSLLQDEMQGRLPPGIAVGTAVDMLRDLAEQRRRTARDLLT
jgi:hypothetical protein